VHVNRLRFGLVASLALLRHRAPIRSIVAEIVRGIRRTSPTHFDVSEHARQKIGDVGLDLLRARIVREEEDGEPPAVRLFGIRPTDVLGALGLENGDRVENVSGQTIDSEKSARDALDALRTATTCTVRLKRRGQPLELRYDIVAR
jgi:general secretion pathway protein C